jgi:RimJ/RimL family protein N-acetyltransferase
MSFDPRQPRMTLTAPLLENRFVRLEPLAEAHREDLRASCNADEDIWERLYPYSWQGDHFDAAWDRYQSAIAAGRIQPFAVVVEGRCAGTSGFLNIDGANSVVEIGGTYYRPDLRGGATNPAAKRLLLAHAFDCGARRVTFRVDSINARSRAAVTKLGATLEGILRAEMVVWTGRVRDTCMFSILREEWPGVRERLDGRLASLFSAEAAAYV